MRKAPRYGRRAFLVREDQSRDSFVRKSCQPLGLCTSLMAGVVTVYPPSRGSLCACVSRHEACAVTLARETVPPLSLVLDCLVCIG